MTVTLILLIAIPIIYFLFNHLVREFREIEPSLLNYQSSISETRQATESAIYRSVDVPHGTGITRGLALRSGYKIRDGCLKDIWYIGFASDVKNHETSVTLGNKSFSLAQVNAIIHFIAQKLKVDNRKTIALYGDLSENLELLLIIWSCFFVSDIKVIHYNKQEDFSLKGEGLKSLVTTDSCFNEIPPNAFDETICFTFDSVNVTNNFNKVIRIPDNIEPSYTYTYNPDIDFAHANNNPYSTVYEGEELKFFQVNFVSAVASRLLSTPASNAWSNKDRLLISFSSADITNKSIIFESCCGIMSQVKSIQILHPSSVLNLKRLSTYQPSILVTDSHSLKDIVNNNRKSFWQSFKLQRSEYFNSIGYFNSFGKIEKNVCLKTTYIYQHPLPLSAYICNFCKSVLGCKVVREIHTEFSIGPILKTNIFDFRIIQHGLLQLYGVPANSVELKTINFSNVDSKGRLYVRGMSVGKGNGLSCREDYWVDAKIDGVFARDGCFYGRV